MCIDTPRYRDYGCREFRQKRGIQGSQGKLTPGQIERLLEEYEEGVGSFPLAAKYGVAVNTVNRYARGRRISKPRGYMSERADYVYVFTGG